MPHKKQKRERKKNKKNTNKKEIKEIKEVINLEINNNNEKEVNQINDNNHDNLDDIKKAFEYFDIAHTGKIHISYLTKALSTFGDIMTEEEMNNIFKSAGINLNDNEEIDYNKFINSWIGDN